MALGRTGLDIINDVARQLGWNQLASIEPVNGKMPKDDAKLLAALNRVLRVLSGMHEWFFLKKESHIITVAPYLLGVVRVTNGSTAITGLDDPATVAVDPPVWTVAMEGRAIRIGGEAHVYRIDRVNSPTSITLDIAYQGTTSTGAADAPDKNYIIAQDRYDLPADFDRPVDDQWTVFETGAVYRMAVKDNEFLRARRRNRTDVLFTDRPEIVTIWDSDEQKEHRVAILDYFPDAQYLITFQYAAIHPRIEQDSDRLLFPARYEEMVLDGIEYLMTRGPEDDERAMMALDAYLRERNDGLSKEEHGQRRKRITQSVGHRVRERMRWGRGRGARGTDYGARFDHKDFHDLDR